MYRVVRVSGCCERTSNGKYLIFIFVFVQGWQWVPKGPRLAKCT